MDLSRFSDAELDALEKGDLSAISDANLDYLEKQITPKEKQQEEKKPTRWEDVEIGLKNLENMFTTGGTMIAAPLLKAMGREDLADKGYATMEAEKARHEKEIAGYGKQDIPGQIISGLTSIAPIIATAPFGAPAVFGAGATQAGIGALADAQRDVQLDPSLSMGKAILKTTAVGGLNTAAMALPAGKGWVPGALWGAGGNVGAQFGTDLLGQWAVDPNSEAAKAYELTPEKYIVSGSVGGLAGAPIGGLSKGSPTTPPPPRVEPTLGPVGEHPVSTPREITVIGGMDTPAEGFAGEAPPRDGGAVEGGPPADRNLPYKEQFELETENRDLDAIALYERQLRSAEVQKAFQEERIAAAEKQLAEGKTFESKEDAADFQRQIEARKRSVEVLENTIRTLEDLSRPNEVPAVMQSRRQGEEFPSSLPPRPEVQEFVRESGAKSDLEGINNDMFDQGDVQPTRPIPEDIFAQEGTTIEPTATKETSPDTPIGREEPLAPEMVSQPENQTVTPFETPVEKVLGDTSPETRQADLASIPIEELTIDQVNERISRPDTLTKEEFPKLLERLAELQGEEPVRPTIRGGTKEEREAVEAILKETGFDKGTDLDINLDDPTMGASEGRLSIDPASDSPIIRVSPTEFIKRAIEGSSKIQSWLKLASPEQIAKFKKMMIVAHEIGHLMLYKLIQNDIYVNDLTKLFNAYENWKMDNRAEVDAQSGVYTKFGDAATVEYFAQFPEFFAQMVAKAMIQPDRATVGPISKFATGFKKIWNNLRAKFGLDLTVNNMVDDFVNQLLVANKKSLDETGKTLFEIKSTKGSAISLRDAALKHHRMFGYKTKNELDIGAGPQESKRRARMALDSKRIARQIIKDSRDVIEEQKSEPDPGPIGLGTGLGWFTEIPSKAGFWMENKLFGLHQKDQFYKRSPAIKHATDVILSAIDHQVEAANKLLSGVPTLEEFKARMLPMWTPLSRIRTEDSLSTIAQKATNEDFSIVHDLLDANYGKKTYEETLSENLLTLSPRQQKLFKILTDMYSAMFKMAEQHAKELGKKNLIPYVKGWFPAVREQGDYSINFFQKGANLISDYSPEGDPLFSDLIYRQSFRTKEEAEAVLAKWDALDINKKGSIKHTGIVENAPNNDIAMRDMREKFLNDYQTLLSEVRGQEGATLGDLQARIQNEYNLFIARGGTLGQHHKFRSNIAGFRGTELFKDVGGQGQSFRDANFSSVEDYTRLMMKMTIEEKLSLIVNDEGLKKSHPNVVEVVGNLRDYALNDTHKMFEMKSLEKVLDSAYINLYKANPKFMKAIGFQQYPKQAIMASTLGKSMSAFYTYVLMTRPSFAIAQGSQSMWSMRSLVKDGKGPVDAMAAMGKGVASMMHQSDDFVKAVFWASQNRHVFHPSFIHDLNTYNISDFLQAGTKRRLVLDLLTGEKQSTAGDTFSRLTTFAVMLEHYKDVGLKGEALYARAAKETDANMVQYGGQFKAPIFRDLGVIGDIISPLQTFPQAALGNMIADVKDIIAAPGGKAKLQATLPLMTTMFITTLMAGVIGAPFMAEMEFMRRMINTLLEKVFGAEAEPIPSLIDIVLAGDNTFSNRVLSHGLVSASTYAVSDQGYDVGSSLRWQAIYGGILSGEKAWYEFAPALKFSWDTGKAVGTLTQGLLGKELLSEEKRNAILDVTPGGYKALADIGLGSLNREFVPDRKGDPIVKQTGEEIVAQALGTNTISTHTLKYKMRRLEEHFNRTSEKVTREKKFLIDAIIKKDTESFNRHAKELVDKYKITPQELESYLKTEYLSKKIPQETLMKSRTGPSALRKNLLYEELYGEKGE